MGACNNNEHPLIHDGFFSTCTLPASNDLQVERRGNKNYACYIGNHSLYAGWLPAR